MRLAPPVSQDFSSEAGKCLCWKITVLRQGRKGPERDPYRLATRIGGVVVSLVEELWPNATAEERALLMDDAPWEGLGALATRLGALWRAEAGGYEVALGDGAEVDTAVVRASQVLIGPGVRIEPTAVLVGEHITIRDGAVIRAGAYVRGPAYIGAGAIVGHATEVKGAILLHRSQAPHFAYVGDSILGTGCNLGAGTKLSNVRLDGRTVRIRVHGERIDTGRHKMGALIGEDVQIGCNAVLNPGTVLFPGTHVAPCTSIRGTFTAGVRVGGP